MTRLASQACERLLIRQATSIFRDQSFCLFVLTQVTVSNPMQDSLNHSVVFRNLVWHCSTLQRFVHPRRAVLAIAT
jgi:hypothetical protein